MASGSMPQETLQEAGEAEVRLARDPLDPLDALQRRIGYHFRSRKLLDQALTHSSLAYERQQPRTPQDDNEQLEFLGDAVLGLTVTEHLYRAYPDLHEGALTQLRAQLVSRKHLGQMARTLSLGDALHLGKGEERNGGRKKSALLSNALEALIAAIYLDGGLAPAAEFVSKWLLQGTLEALADASRSGLAVGDHKSMLQEYFQARGMGQPRYVVTAESGPDHHKTFVVALQLLQPGGGPRLLASACGLRKKNAEQEAARLALEALQGTGTHPEGTSPDLRGPHNLDRPDDNRAGQDGTP
ncbi:MAG: ribonuclease III [Acidobacteriaceae bacterium]